MDMRNQIWNCLLNCKYQSCYIDFLLDKYQKIDWCINISLAILSSASIASWAIWQKFPFVWSTAIAVSQIVGVIKPYLPFTNYIVQLRDKSPLMKQLNFDYEKLWYEMEFNKISDDDVVNKHFDLKKRNSDILNFKSQHKIFTDEKINKRVDNFMKDYEKNNFGIERS